MEEESQTRLGILWDKILKAMQHGDGLTDFEAKETLRALLHAYEAWRVTQ